MCEQIAATGQPALGLGADQQFDCARPPRKSGIEVALAVGHYGNGCGPGRAQACRRLGTSQPAAGFFLIRRAGRLFRGCTMPLPELHVGQPQDDVAVRVNRQHWMHEKGRVGTVAASAERGLAARMPREVDFAGVLNRQHTASSHLRQQMRLRRGDQRRLAHTFVAQKPSEGLLTGFIAAKPFDADRAAQHHAPKQLLPLFCSRSSPNTPRSSTIVIAASIQKTAKHGIIDPTVPPLVPSHPSQHVALMARTGCVHPIGVGEGVACLHH